MYHHSDYKLLTMFLNKSFLPSGKNSTLKSADYAYFLAKASQANTYIETVGNKADSLHRRIELTYEENIIESLKMAVKKLVKKAIYGKVTLAIDFTDEPFFGETRNFFTYGVKPEHGYNSVFRFAVVSIVDNEKSIPLLALPVRVGSYKGKIVEQLLRFAKSICKIRLVLFDRGFYSADVISTLKRLGIKYLMLVPKNEAVKKYVKNTFVFEEYEHELILNENKSKYKIKTKILVCKHFDEYDWTFATNLPRQNAAWYIYKYKKRWQIETNFRVEDEAKIKSKSTNYLVRYFYFAYSILLHAIWITFEKMKKTFKAFLINLYEKLFCSMLKIEHLQAIT